MHARDVLAMLALGAALPHLACATASGPERTQQGPRPGQTAFYNEGKEILFGADTSASRTTGPDEFLPVQVVILNRSKIDLTVVRESFTLVRPDGDVALINGASLPANTDPDYEFDYLEISNVNYYGVIELNTIERSRYEDAPSRARRRVGKNSTVISSVRPNLHAVAFLADGRSDLVCSTGFNVVQAHEKTLNPKFVYYALVSEAGRQYFEATAKRCRLSGGR